MLSVRSAPLAILLEVDFAFDEFLVFSRPIVDAVALGAGKLYELILGHARDYT